MKTTSSELLSCMLNGIGEKNGCRDKKKKKKKIETLDHSYTIIQHCSLNFCLIHQVAPAQFVDHGHHALFDHPDHVVFSQGVYPMKKQLQPVLT